MRVQGQKIQNRSDTDAIKKTNDECKNNTIISDQKI